MYLNEIHQNSDMLIGNTERLPFRFVKARRNAISLFYFVFLFILFYIRWRDNNFQMPLNGSGSRRRRVNERMGKVMNGNSDNANKCGAHLLDYCCLSDDVRVSFVSKRVSGIIDESPHV